MTATAIDPHDFVNSLRNSLPAIHPALSDARRKQTGDALPKQVQAVIETGVALAKDGRYGAGGLLSFAPRGRTAQAHLLGVTRAADVQDELMANAAFHRPLKIANCH
jgi:hypothetical protein